MTALALAFSSKERRSLDLLDALVSTPMSMTEACDKLELTPAQFRAALGYLRDRVCPELGLVIPHPIPDDGYRYHATGEWATPDGTPAAEAGTAWALGLIESRLRRVLGDIEIVLPNLDPQSEHGRKANFLKKHVSHIVSTMAEIGSPPVG